MTLSLKWKIQAWYALVLAVVLGHFGIGFYHYEKAHRLGQVDAMLDQKMGPILFEAERKLPDGPRGPPRNKSSAFAPQPGLEPGGGWVRRTLPIDEFNQSRRKDFKQDAFAYFNDQLARSGHYAYAFSRKTGELVFKSEGAPELDFPTQMPPGYHLRTREGRYRELYHASPSTALLTGYHLDALQEELGHLKLQITGGTVSVYVLSLILGGILVFRSVAPLEEIRRTASAISKGDVKARIHKSTDSSTNEIRLLSRDLNTTFETLSQLYHRQVQFTSDASHELRTPLTALVSHIDLGLDRVRSPEEYVKLFATCKRSATRIQRITDDLLELSRLDSGEVRLDLEPMPLDSLLQDLCEDLRPHIERNGSLLEMDLKPVRLCCDPFRLEQVVTNLVNNALQHNSQPIKIGIHCALERDWVKIEAVDNGKGIQAENIDKLFDRFYREDPSHSANGRAINVGLGLAISKAIVEAHGGSIHVSSQSGVETKFSIRLPL
ncbi:HAMP domain-containing sensor histidine kinase [Coraliomargarita algicola]|uniref:histidine kinase n=1 Tax=Coraliomargarita algicola TaxID=3092156 RepID=A0ABZ0RQX7_9BACT|nr:HAMP domain-containing sensor histidine kinase [Coraliomargarita sp. J2-16]WPJ97508.1 HAMP domain-containing sensor histidine kinase [Coraliomargarita sp. J2-16]